MFLGFFPFFPHKFNHIFLSENSNTVYYILSIQTSIELNLIYTIAVFLFNLISRFIECKAKHREKVNITRKENRNDFFHFQIRVHIGMKYDRIRPLGFVN